MKIYSVLNPCFRPYGRVLEGYDTAPLLEAMGKIDLPERGKTYQPGIASLENTAIYRELGERVYGGMPIQLGMCWGRNTRLDCLEYHRDSEVNIGTGDFILLLARMEDVDPDFKLDTSRVVAFRVPAGGPVEIYSTTLHYAPCHTDEKEGFRVAVALPRGTNTYKPAFDPRCPEDRLLRARNKWLIAHPEAPEAADGAFVGLTGENIDIKTEVQ